MGLDSVRAASLVTASSVTVTGCSSRARGSAVARDSLVVRDMTTAVFVHAIVAMKRTNATQYINFSALKAVLPNAYFVSKRP